MPKPVMPAQPSKAGAYSAREQSRRYGASKLPKPELRSNPANGGNRKGK